ncbi:MAG: GntR family transcriptional regulator [Frankiaceae bacterium]
MASEGVDPTSDRPVFRQIADLLRAQMLDGSLPEGARLPSERELMETYGAARGTVRQSVAQLKAEGLIQMEHGRGAFVRRRPPVRRVASDRFARRHRDEGKGAFTVETEAEGLSTGVEVLKVGPEHPPPDIAERLSQPPTDRVLVRRRRYLADGEPVEIATSYVPWDLASGTPMTRKNPGPGGIYARLEETGHRLSRFAEEVTARMPVPDESRSLRLSAGVPVFVLVRTAYDSEGRAVEVCDTVMAADRFVLAYDLPAG